MDHIFQICCDLLTNWQSILDEMSNISLVDSSDRVVWTMSANGRFTVKSVYNALTTADSGPHHKKFGKGEF